MVVVLVLVLVLVELEVDVEVVDVLVLVLVVEVKSLPSWLYPVLFPNPPISSKVTFSARFTSLSLCWKRLVFRCIPLEKSSITLICKFSSTSGMVRLRSPL